MAARPWSEKAAELPYCIRLLQRQGLTKDAATEQCTRLLGPGGASGEGSLFKSASSGARKTKTSRELDAIMAAYTTPVDGMAAKTPKATYTPQQMPSASAVARGVGRRANQRYRKAHPPPRVKSRVERMHDLVVDHDEQIRRATGSIGGRGAFDPLREIGRRLRSEGKRGRRTRGGR